MIDLNLIHTFLAVSETKNLHQTAKKLLITQSAVSQRIKTLEGQIGKDLFIRTRTGMTINNTGKHLYSLCKCFNNDIKSITHWIDEQRGNIGGRIIISSWTTPLKYIFPSFLNKFLKKYPKVSINFRMGVSADVEEDVASGLADIGVLGQCKKPMLLQEKIFQNNFLIMACSPDYHLAKKKRVTVKDLKNEKFIGELPPHSRSIRKLCSHLGLSFNTDFGTIRLPDMEYGKYFAMNGLGIAIIANIVIQEELKAGKLIALPGFTVQYNGYLVSRKEEFESPTIKIFKKEFKMHCKQLDKKWGEDTNIFLGKNLGRYHLLFK